MQTSKLQYPLAFSMHRPRAAASGGSEGASLGSTGAGGGGDGGVTGDTTSALMSDAWASDVSGSATTTGSSRTLRRRLPACGRGWYTLQRNATSPMSCRMSIDARTAELNRHEQTRRRLLDGSNRGSSGSALF
eukprot:6555678-Prymnesium_polylepis.1